MTHCKWVGTPAVKVGVLTLAFAVAGLAQITTATIFGRVLDQTQALVPGATVMAINEETALEKAGITGGEGSFTIPFVLPGTYTIQAEAPGFKTYRQSGLEIASTDQPNLTIVLELGMTTETVEVTGAAPLLNTVSARQSISLNNLAVKELPVLNRDVTGIVALGAGAAGTGSTIALNGLASRGFTFTVDGVNAVPDSEFAALSTYGNFNFIKGVSFEAVREVETSKNIFSAEIANTLSGNVNIISKSGTNQLHGSLFELYASGGLHAISHFVPTKAPSVFHQFGASVGGPIVKNKSFVFFVYEGYRLTESKALSGQIPSLEIRAIGSAAIPESKPYWDLWPQPTEAGVPGENTTFFAGTRSANRADNHTVLRFDQYINQNNNFTFRWVRARPDRLTPRLPRASDPRSHIGESDNIAISYTRVWSPTFTSELRFGDQISGLRRFDRNRFSGPDPEHGLNAIRGMGIPWNYSGQFNKDGREASVEQNFTKIRGTHTLKFGVRLGYLSGTRIYENTPIFEYATRENLANNDATNSEFSFKLNNFLVHKNFYGGFVQDQIRLRPNLMVTLGLRYDVQTVPDSGPACDVPGADPDNCGDLYNRFGRYGKPGGSLENDATLALLFTPHDSVFNAYRSGVGPRGSFAWTLGQDQKTVVRGGFGIFFMPRNLFGGTIEIIRNNAREPGEAHASGAELRAIGADYTKNNDDLVLAFQEGGVIADSSLTQSFPEPYSVNWTFGIERQLSDTLVWEIDYVGNHGVKLTYNADDNRVDRITGIRPSEQMGLAPHGGFRYYQTAESTRYDALQTQLKKRFSNNLQFNMSYTYASNMSYHNADLGCCGGSANPQDVARLDLNRSGTPFHNRHRYTTDFVYELPFAKNASSRAVKHILGGWQISGIVELRTGTPIRIGQHTSSSRGGRPDIGAGFTYAQSIRGTHDTVLPDGSYRYIAEGIYEEIPTSVVSGAQIVRGNIGRGPIYGPGFMNTNASFAKNIHVAEGHRVQLRVDMFNFLNHTNFTRVNASVRSGGFGRITGTGPGRRLQLSARYDF